MDQFITILKRKMFKWLTWCVLLLGLFCLFLLNILLCIVLKVDVEGKDDCIICIVVVGKPNPCTFNSDEVIGRFIISDDFWFEIVLGRNKFVGLLFEIFCRKFGWFDMGCSLLNSINFSFLFSSILKLLNQ